MNNLNIPKWIKSSVLKYLSTQLSDVKIFTEGEPRDTSGLSQWLEIRLEGPHIFETVKSKYRYDIRVNILVSQIISNNLYEIETLIGKVLNILRDIPIYQYGDGSTFIDMLQLVQNNKIKVETYNFGQLNQDVKLLQASITGTFVLWR